MSSTTEPETMPDEVHSYRQVSHSGLPLQAISNARRISPGERRIDTSYRSFGQPVPFPSEPSGTWTRASTPPTPPRPTEPLPVTPANFRFPQPQPSNPGDSSPTSVTTPTHNVPSSDLSSYLASSPFYLPSSEGPTRLVPRRKPLPVTSMIQPYLASLEPIPFPTLDGMGDERNGPVNVTADGKDADVIMQVDEGKSEGDGGKKLKKRRKEGGGHGERSEDRRQGDAGAEEGEDGQKSGGRFRGKITKWCGCCGGR